MTKHLVSVVSILWLAGCQMSAPQVSLPNLGNDMVENCGAEDLQNLIGQPKSVLDSMRFSQTLRVIEPGMMVTEDYSPSRLNIYVNGAGIISELRCG